MGLDMLQNESNITVAVYMICYNHEDYIEQAIESIMVQKTNFQYKLFIGEDCSTDKTRTICISLKKKHPNKIELLLQDKNIGPSKNAQKTYDLCFRSNAKYIAMCEGDDYWTDPHKLQKQVDFLEANPDFNISFHNASIWENSEILPQKIYPNNRKEIISFVDLMKGDYTKTCCSVFRNNLDLSKKPLNIIQDTTLFLSCLENGAKAHYMDEDMAVYRKHDGGIYSLIGRKKQHLIAYDIQLFLLNYYEPRKEVIYVKYQLKYLCVNLSAAFLKEGDLKQFLFWLRRSFNYPFPNTLKLYYNTIRILFINKNLFKLNTK
mgnify:CR=1 FL=1